MSNKALLLQIINFLHTPEAIAGVIFESEGDIRIEDLPNLSVEKIDRIKQVLFALEQSSKTCCSYCNGIDVVALTTFCSDCCEVGVKLK